MLKPIRRTVLTVAALAALGLGAAAIAGAVDKNNSSSGNRSSQTRPQREELSAADAAKVKAAALDKVPGATVLETEAGGPYDTPYHAHIQTANGDAQVVLVDASFTATAVQDEMAHRGRGPGGPGDHDGGPGDRDGHPGPGGPRGDETALTGDKKAGVEAAVLAKYAGAKIVRTETNADGGAPYESHITTTAGKELEVLVSNDFKVVEAR